MKKVYVIGDIHGAYKALIQCLKLSNFNYQIDRLIVLGDVVDGWTETPKVIDELLKIKDLVFIMGNHDWWAFDFFKSQHPLKEPEPLWFKQGGYNTLKAYDSENILQKPNMARDYTKIKMPKKHLDFFYNANLWYTENNDSQLFVHGGIDPNKKAEKQDRDYLLWDRTLIKIALIKHYDYNFKNNKLKEENLWKKLSSYQEIFIGHTPTLHFGGTVEPIHFCNVWGLDTGAGWDGKLTIMDIKTKEFWQSGFVTDLYPNSHGRKDAK